MPTLESLLCSNFPFAMKPSGGYSNGCANETNDIGTNPWQRTWARVW